MSGSAALAQLMDMGIPIGRAKAALLRSKDDAMTAAERVFSGEFDDIPSEDEDEDEATGLQTPQERGDAAGLSDDDVYDDDDVLMDEDDDDGGFDDDGGYDDFQFEDDAGHVPQDLDPYAGIFFSKDRTERLIETVEKPVFVEVPVASGSGGGPSYRKERVRILSRGEWMSGCPEGNEQSFLFQLYELVAEGALPCANGCGYETPRSPEHFFALFPTFPAYTAHLASLIEHECPNCHHTTCRACGEAVTTGSSSKGKAKGKSPNSDGEIESLLHCLNAQGVIIGVGLHMIEEGFSAAPALATPDEKDETHPTKKRKVKKLMSKFVAGGNEDDLSDSDMSETESPALPGNARGRSYAKGTGYSGTQHEDRSGQIAAERAQALNDSKTSTLLSQVQVYLPALNRASGPRASDHLVHPTALAHLRRRSGFVNDLLRNDSLMDMSNRGTLYRALFDWLEIVSSHESLASMLAMPQMRPVRTEPGPDKDTVNVVYEGGPSPRELLESVVIQATSALKGLTSTAAKEEEKAVDLTQSVNALDIVQPLAPVEDDDQNGALKTFCERIVQSAATIDRLLADTKGDAFVKRMRESLPRLHTAVQVQESADATNEAIITIYEEWARKVRFQYTDLINPKDASQENYFHCYNEQIKKLAGMDAPKRSLAIAKELAILTTSLPSAWHSSIFLRVDDSRVDCIKAMIIGPEGTPYENGCFIFDIFLPLEYNIKCPAVKSMTTNGGKYRYNPNLYNDGKVCLSLLGTWSGPGWVSGKSTLLQVLISIQSLILCEEPYLNEPGWANQAGTVASKAYSANVRRMVVEDAMGNNLANPPFPFENEIKTHFRLKADVIRAQLEQWKTIDDGKSTTGDSYTSVQSATSDRSSSKATSFETAADRMRELLEELKPSGAGPVPAAAAAASTPRRSNPFRSVKKLLK
ncbi:hypothetical protein Q8F55_000310 [Vanrija albida]|uniref:UBC core domain-containing protein n=1 Tax=Vanrija albida TaxID=181172 RepID=A0ABR3QDU4_9TREE